MKETFFKKEGRSNKIRILFIIDYLFEISGTEKHLLQLIRELDKSQFKCYLLALQHSDKMLQQYTRVGAQVLPWHLDKFYSLKTLQLLKQLKEFIIREKVHFIQSYNVVADLVAALVTKMAGGGVVHIMNVRDMGGYRKGRYNIIMKVLKSRRKDYLAVCHTVAEHFSSSNGVNNSRIKVIYNGIDSPFCNNPSAKSKHSRQVYPISNDSFVVGNISQFRPEKGHEVFFKAVELVRKEIPEIVALAIGGGPLLSMYQKQYRSQRASGNIIITGFLDDVHPALAKMDIFCFTPVSNEGFSNAILEAMAFGKPVIASDVGGNREAVVHGTTGHVVPAGEPDKIAKAILDLYRTPEKMQAMGQAGKVRVQQHFSLEKIIPQYERFYLEKINDVHGVN